MQPDDSGIALGFLGLVRGVAFDVTIFRLAWLIFVRAPPSWRALCPVQSSEKDVSVPAGSSYPSKCQRASPCLSTWSWDRCFFLPSVWCLNDIGSTPMFFKQSIFSSNKCLNDIDASHQKMDPFRMQNKCLQHSKLEKHQTDVVQNTGLALSSGFRRTEHTKTEVKKQQFTDIVQTPNRFRLNTTDVV